MLKGLEAVVELATPNTRIVPGHGAIVDERARRPFASVEDLRRVRGIGPATVRSLAPELFVGADPACDPSGPGLTRSAGRRPG